MILYINKDSKKPYTLNELRELYNECKHHYIKETFSNYINTIEYSYTINVKESKYNKNRKEMEERITEQYIYK